MKCLGFRSVYLSLALSTLIAPCGGERARKFRVFILTLIGLLLFRIWRIGRLAEDAFGLLISVGIFSMILFQTFQSVGMSTGIMPITGIPLPLISYGGSSIVTTFLGLGLVESVHMRRHERSN